MPVSQPVAAPQAFHYPPNIERRSDGALVLRGHRIKLHTLLQELSRGATVDQLAEMFPTVARDDLRIIARFYRTRPRDAGYFLVQGKSAEAAAMRKVQASADLDELRQRRSRRASNAT